MGSKRKANAPVRWQPHPELPPPPPATPSDGGSLLRAASLLGGARRSGTDTVAPPTVERNLLSQFKGDAKPQSRTARPPRSLALSLRVGSEEDQEKQNRPANATIHGHGDSSHRSLDRGGSGSGRVPQQPVQAAAGSAAAPSPPFWPRSSATPRHVTSIDPGYAAGATRRQRCGVCSFYRGLLEVATAEVSVLRAVNGELRRQVWSSFREELAREQRKVSLPQHAASSAGASLLCPACWVRPATVVLLPHEHLCLCRHCLDAWRGDPSIACPRCATARAEAAVDAAPR